MKRRPPRPLDRIDLAWEKIPEAEADELHRRALAGDIAARNRIAEANLALAGWFSGLFHFGPIFDGEHVVASAMRGIVEAAARHDPARGTRFATTAYSWMLKCVMEDVGEHRFPVSVPLNMRRAPGHHLKVHGGSRVGDDLRRARDARSVGLTEAADVEWRAGLDLAEIEAAEHAVAMLGQIPAREREVIARRLGLHGHDPQTFAQIGRLFGFSSSRADQLYRMGLRRLRDILGAEARPDDTDAA